MVHITVIGELCDDFFVYGDSKKLSPEAPVAVLTPLYTNGNLGMAGNVKENLRALNPEVSIILIHQKNKITKTRYVDEKSNHMFLRVDEGENDVDELFLSDEHISTIMSSDIVIVSDYNKGFVNEETICKIGQSSKLSIIDTKKKITKNIIDSFDYIKLNENEYNSNKDISDLNKNKFIITLGMKGAKYNDVVFPSPAPIQTMDVSGAGDTFTASFILNYYETKNIEESIKFANKISSFVVTKRGVAKPW